ncbi:hypothetical protein T231_09045 [Tannerella sp. oral taxon BU063 isolate Cell 6/7/9]|uniref:Uncharacterized protein n=1 Tax=Tannerella sp. oral taxon BU063 isolate Cell 6/7/9 TaxID=1411021 RepID=W2CQX0_9BACT|nr:hypothetical protein T231_09045 [Tannerella sp. oral taxon BU063 isolate Cell 6/7/9]
MPSHTFRIELRVALPFRPPEHDPFGLFTCQRFAGALADQVALDLGRESEGEGEHLALYVFAQPIVVLDGPHTTLLRHADVEDLHNHKQVAP